MTQAIGEELLITPGQVFSPGDTRFRISFATTPQTRERAVGVLRKLARQG